MVISDKAKELLKESGMDDKFIDALLKADEVAGKDEIDDGKWFTRD